MKKKIGDLTIRELKKEQDKICNKDTNCSECPFEDCCVDIKIDLEKEVEVE